MSETDDTLRAEELELTISARDRVSFSGVIVVLWIKNLSLHFAANGGSSFIAWSMTGSPPHNE